MDPMGRENHRDGVMMRYYPMTDPWDWYIHVLYYLHDPGVPKPIPSMYHPCMVYLATFTININQM